MIRKPSYKNIYKNFEDSELRTELADNEWLELKQNLLERGSFNNRTAKIVDRLVREYVYYEFEYEQVVLDGAVKLSENGGEYYSMKWAALEKSKNHILKLEEALKIPPEKILEKKLEQLSPTAADEFIK